MNDNLPEPPIWRSLLYVPANNERFVVKAHTRGADAIILDLEDSVPAAERPAARSNLANAVKAVGQSGADVTVRINRPLRETIGDLEAAVISGVRALFVAKTESPDHLRLIDEIVSDLEAERGLPPRGIGFSVMIESPGALRKAADIAASSPRVVAMSLGGEDFAMEMHAPPDPETLELPKLLCLMAAREAGVMPLGFLGTVADYTNLEGVRGILTRSRKFGFEGGSCIHPAMIPLLNEAFAPTREEVDWAQRVVTEYAAAQRQGKGAITIDGKMVDVPVAIRAGRLLARHEAIAAKTGTTL
ncbi:MAG: CoA ester lyase [Hyphomicrobiaceae bacterium]|nr:CoA ester lyase [Hyphomicrobiaceae bacterium]